MSNRTEARSAKAARMHATGRLPLLRLFSTPLASLTMSAPSSIFWADWSVGSKQSAISLSLRVLLVPTQSPLVIVFQVRNSVRPMHLFGLNRDHDYYFELPR
jgi:hypothetical protein